MFKAVGFALFVLGFVGCASPTKRVDELSKKFRKDHPDQIVQITTSFGPLGYAWAGDPSLPPLVFVHGSPGSWDGWIEYLLNPDLQKRWHLIAVDRPGYGGSNAGQSMGSLAQQAKVVRAVLEANRSGQPAVWVGHSFGGPVIAQIAVDFPNDTAGLIFVASSVDPALEKIEWYQKLGSWWPFRAIIPEMLRVCNEEIMALKPELETLAARWGEIRGPVVSIQGQADTLVPPANQDFIRSHLRASVQQEHISVPGMNHFVPWEHPELILSAIQKFQTLK